MELFVYTLKASGLKFFAIIAISVAVLATLIGILPAVNAESDAANVNIDYGDVSSESDMVNFLSGFGYEVDPNVAEISEVTIPEEFDSAFRKYNEIQRAQGLNLKRHIGKTAKVYTFRVKNYGTEGEVYATLIVRNGKIIAGDICSQEGEGFVHGFKKPVEDR